jgi:hypothetical protein
MSKKKDKRGKKKSEKHWPTLNTVIMVESTLKNLKEVISVAELKRRLPRKVNHNTLMLILEYLEESNKVLMTIKGLTWIHNSNLNLNNHGGGI